MSSQIRMSAFKQLNKNAVLQTLELANPNVSVQHSIKLMQQMTIAGVSSICYQRFIFPEGAFKEKKFGNMRLQILIGNNNNPGAQKLINWIKGAFKAVEDRYLKNMILIIEKPTGDAVETYTFNFSYAREAIDIYLQTDLGQHQLEVNSQQPCPEEIEKCFRLMMRKLFVYANQLEPLPENSEVRMTLEFYDNIPLDYVMPNGFDPLESSNVKFQQEATDYEMGRVESKFHSYRITTKSILHSMEPAEENDLAQNEEEDMVPESQPFEENSEKSFMTPISIVSQPHKSQGTQLTNESSTLVGARSAKIVKCICELLDDSNEIIKCKFCHTYQHKACYKILEDEEVSGLHVCVDCHEPNNYAKSCICPELFDKTNRRELALYRRALVLCTCQFSNRISINSFVTQLNIPRDIATKIFQRLDADGCLGSTVGKRSIRNIELDHLRNRVLPQNFSDMNLDEMETEENCMNKINTEKRKSSSVEMEHDSLWKKKRL